MARVTGNNAARLLEPSKAEDGGNRTEQEEETESGQVLRLGVPGSTTDGDGITEDEVRSQSQSQEKVATRPPDEP